MWFVSWTDTFSYMFIPLKLEILQRRELLVKSKQLSVQMPVEVLMEMMTLTALMEAAVILQLKQTPGGKSILEKYTLYQK